MRSDGILPAEERQLTADEIATLDKMLKQGLRRPRLPDAAWKQ